MWLGVPQQYGALPQAISNELEISCIFGLLLAVGVDDGNWVL